MDILSYDNSAMDEQLASLQDRSKIKICKACGKEFVPGPERNSGRRRYCYRQHYLICEGCGKEFNIDPVGYNITCSRECRKIVTQKSLVKSMKDKYGVTNPSQHPEFAARAAATRASKQEEMTAHYRESMNRIYGGIGMQSPELRQRIEASIKDKYGVDNVAKAPEVRKKISDRLKSQEIRTKYSATSRLHYGVDHPAQSEEIQYAMRKTCMEKYGVEYSGSLPSVIEKRKQTSLERFGYTTYLSTDAAREKARKSVLEHFSGRISNLNKQFHDVLEEHGVQSEFEFYLGRKWYDLHVLDSNIVIEIDPSYTHSTIPSHWMPEGMDPGYHAMKSEVAESNGFRCVHVFDWDDWDKIADMLKYPSSKIGARECELREVQQEDLNNFLNKYHIQRSVNGTKEAYGLYYSDLLVQVMTFGKPRYTNKYDFELLRLCTIPDYAISGGAEKLFCHFLKIHPSNSILSYCDLAKFSGEVYSRLGFQLDHISKPAKIWSRDKDKITDNLLRQRGYDQLFNTSYGKGTSNEQLMLDNRWLPVYDCGQAVYVYQPSEVI